MQALLRNFKNYLNQSTTLQKIRVYNRIAFSPKYLLFTNVCISISLSCVGDCLEQQYELFTKDLDQYSGKRTVHMALSGSTVGVICHYWYKFLDKRMPGRSLSIVLKKVFWDQMICSPVVISTFFLTLGVLEQSSREEVIAEIKNKAWKLYAAEWVVWPPAQVINFYLLPNKYRVLYDNTISLGYDVYTSKVKHGK
ncbi:mpv17-like protein 2 [Bradysia coprophila]|uniref:mpv17-like protein 2 n=1 Tax=Bradysia coprophila TaxID=38358 RepID=UPI00187D90E2|nr:mpv17-like protein 2 [Bradysia coprophila]